MIVKHAIMYAAAFIGTTFAVPQLSPDSTILAILIITFRPLQGFFNALIFISQKVYIIRQADKDLTFYKALNSIIISPSIVPAIVIELPSRLTTLRNGSASSSCLSFPTRKSNNDPSLVVSNTAGSTELPAFSFHTRGSSHDPSLVISNADGSTEVPYLSFPRRLSNDQSLSI